MTGPTGGAAMRDGSADILELPQAAARRWRPSGQEGFDDPLAASLLALSRLLERPVTPEALTAGLPLHAGRLTLELLPRAAARAGLAGRLVRRPLHRIKPPALPCILLLDEEEACVLLRREGGACTILLPETGQGGVLLPEAELAARYAGFAFFARPALALPSDEAPGGLGGELGGGHWFWGTLLRHRTTYAEVALAALLINLFALASPLFVMNVYDRVVPNGALATLWVLAAGAVTVFLFDFLLKVLRAHFIDSAGRSIDIELASRLFEQAMAIRMSARPASAGAFASQLREFESLRDFFTSATLATLVDVPFIALFLAAIGLLGGPIALVPGLAVPCVLLIGLLLQLPLNRVMRRAYQEGSRRHGLLSEAIAGLETIKSVSAEGRMQAAWERLVAATAGSAHRSRLFSALTVNLTATAANLVTVGIVTLGVHGIAAGRLTTGALVACTLLAGRAMAPLGQVAGLLTRYHQSRTALAGLEAIMRLPVERASGQRFARHPGIKGGIELRGVGFTYPGQAMPALGEVSLRIKAGERVALVGRIGSGKTTIGKLVLGLHQPDRGAVLIDGIDLRGIDPLELRRSIGAVLQDVVLFQGTLRDNIALSVPGVDDAALLRAAATAGVDRFASRHPSGFELPVGERGEALSGGQRQAVAIARALLLEPPILVLDEPTSAMDPEGEAQLKARLAPELKGRTLLLVTHRASLLSLVERVIVMDEGRPIADGPRDAVVKALASGRIKGGA